jgi:hypothetical protein
MNNKPITESRVFSSCIRHSNTNHAPLEKKILLTYEKVIVDGGDNIIVIEEEIKILISNEKVAISKGKPQSRDARQPQQQPTMTSQASPGKYDSFDRSDAAIEQACTDYVMPLYA